MEPLRVAMMQLLPTGDQEGNLQKGLAACREAKRMGADIAVFPEMWNIGYHMPKNMETLSAIAVAADSPFVRRFGEVAAELDMAVAVTLLEAYQPSPRNTVCLWDRHGHLALTYAKVHT